MTRGLVLVVLVLLGCGKKEEPPPPPAPAPAQAPPTASATAAPTTQDTARPSSVPSVQQTVAVPPGSPPADGKYERVIVEGVTVPMVQVMEGGAVVLVDTDGKKPRTWEEQYKRKRAELKPGQFDLHKTDANKNGDFKDDPIDKEGLWMIDAKGNITKH
jgi:hypothetical protein